MTKGEQMKTERLLVTGSAGFIGFHVAKRLLDDGKQVLGLDNLNDYYDVNLKSARLAQLRARRGFRFVLADVADRAQMERLFQEEPFDYVIHLAA
jgi:UDP-glucuronate 4-epimerase